MLAARRTRTMEVHPFAAPLGFGAEVLHADLGHLSDADADQLRAWMAQYGLLLFRDQQLEVREEVEFARLFEYDRDAKPERLHGLCECRSSEFAFRGAFFTSVWLSASLPLSLQRAATSC